MNRVAGALLVLAYLGLPTTGASQSDGFSRFQSMVGRTTVRTSGVAQVRWLPAGLGYLAQEADSSRGPRFFRVDPESGRRTPLFDARAEARLIAEYARLSGGAPSGKLPFETFTLDPTARLLLFPVAERRYLYDLHSGGLRELQMPSQVGPLDELMTEPGAFSPDYDAYVFVRDYDNLFVIDTRTGAERRLVSGTSENHLTAFIGSGVRFAWSPDRKWIAYLSADAGVHYRYPILRDLTHHATVDYFRYPFTTDPNPSIALHLIEVVTGRQTTVAVGTEEQPYLRDVEWFNDGREVVFRVVNRWENRRELRAADPVTGQVRTILVDQDAAFLDPIDNFRPIDGGRKFIWSSERSGWRHLYLFDRDGRELRQLTSGEWVVGSIAGIDHSKGWIYFDGATELGLERHFFRVRFDGTQLTRLTDEPGVHQVSMDPAATFFTDRSSSLVRAPTTALRRADGRWLRELGTSVVLDSSFASPEILVLEAADGVRPMHGVLYKPADFDSTRRYPLVVSVYGGPHTKAVRNSYRTFDFNAALAQLGFLVVQFDGRGTLDRGKAWQAGAYLRLGQEDVDDQAAGVRQLGMRSYVDTARVGVTGISHGGFMTIMLMLRYPELYHVGVAGAPLTDARTGPRQYIGRMMRTPQENPAGYAEADLLPRAAGLRGRLLIHHGTNDQNVVIGNTMQFVRRAIDAGRPVDMMIYPDGVHVLEGRDAVHGLKTTVSYFLEHLRPEGWESSRRRLWQ